MLIWIVAFISGLSALAYEVLWYREFALLLGNTAHASSLVLAVIFGGLALGNYCAGRWTKSLSRPLLGYAVLEFGMAACGGGVLIIKEWGGALLLPTFFVFLVVMAMLMGGTLPFLIQSIEGKDGGLEKVAPRLYGINTAGAMVGAILAGFFLPPLLGVRGAFFSLIVINLVLAIITAWVGRGQLIDTALRKRKSLKSKGGGISKTALKILFISAFLSGVGTLALEVFWTRMFSLVFQNSVYSFSLILIFILLSLVFSAGWAGKLVRKGWDPLFLIWASFCIVSITVPLCAWFFFQVSDLRFLLREASPVGYVTNIALFTGGILLPVMIPAGMILPLCWMIDRRESATNGWRMGSILSINTVGGIIGAVGSGFILLPQTGLWPGLGLIALSYGFGAILLFRRLPKKEKRSVMLGLATSVGLIFPVLLIWPSLPAQHLKEGETLLSLEQGAEAQVAVVLNQSGGRVLKVNNTYNLGNSSAEVEERRMGEIPLLLHPNPKNVAFVGVATGITASAVYDHHPAHVTLIELLPEVIRAATWFEKENRGILKDSRWETVVADGRIVIPKSKRHLDVVISDLFVPWHAGTGALYSLEHYQEAASKMAPDGLYAQWLPLYQTTYEEFQVIAKTFQEVFPYVSIWRGNFSPKYPIVGLIGSKHPIRIDLDGLSEKLSGFDRKKIGADPYLASAKDFLLLYVGEGGALEPLSSNVPINTDNRPIIEYLAPISHIQKKQLVSTDLANLFVQISKNEMLWSNYAQAGAYLYYAGVAVDRMEYNSRTEYLEKATALVDGSRILERYSMALKLNKPFPALAKATIEGEQ